MPRSCPHQSFTIHVEEDTTHVLHQIRICLSCGDTRRVSSRYIGVTAGRAPVPSAKPLPPRH